MTDNEVKWMIVGKLLRRNLMAVKGEPVATKYPIGRLRCSTVKPTLKYSHNSRWVEVNCDLPDSLTSILWSDGKNTYQSLESTHSVLNGDTWESKIWESLSYFDGNEIWTDGTHIYLSSNNTDMGWTQYVLNGDTWEPVDWKGLDGTQWDGSRVPVVSGNWIWSDGTNIYHSFDKKHYTLNGDTWEPNAWNGVVDFDCDDVWSDGTNIYRSLFTDSWLDEFDRDDQYVLNGDTWEPKVWNGLTSFSAAKIWTDGVNIYFSGGSAQYVLSGDTWEPKVWDGLNPSGHNIWSDGVNIYCSQNDKTYVLK